MTAKEYLRQIRATEARLRMFKNQCEELQQTIIGVSGISYDKPSVMSSPSDDALPNGFNRLFEIQAKLRDEQVKWWKLKAEAMNLIAKLDKDVYIDLLSFRYIDCMSWKDITSQLEKKHNEYYTEEHVRGKLHLNALNAFDEILKRETQDYIEM